MSVKFVKDNSVSFNYFKPDDYYRVTGMREEIKGVVLDDESGGGFERGDVVKLKVPRRWPESMAYPSSSHCIVQGVRENGAILRINGELYKSSDWMRIGN